MTSNAHRIHYDEEYATAIEGLPELVVHGPLLALFMAELTRRIAPGCGLCEFDFRLRRPVSWEMGSCSFQVVVPIDLRRLPPRELTIIDLEDSVPAEEKDAGRH